MRTLIQKQRAWLTNPAQVDDLLKGQEVSFYLSDCDHTDNGWILLGEATCMIQIENEDKLVLDTVARLEEAARKLQADTQVKLMKLQEMKNNLLSLTYTAYHEDVKPIQPAKLPADFNPDDDIPF